MFGQWTMLVMRVGRAAGGSLRLPVNYMIAGSAPTACQHLLHYACLLRALSEQRSGRPRMAQHAQTRPKRPLSRESAPLGQCAGSSLFVDLASDEMALLIEVVVDLGMN